MTRHDESPQIAQEADSASAGHDAACRECGGLYAPRFAASGFCSLPCRRAWNSRRSTRGVELYDLFMALRYDRGASKRLHVWKALCRLASRYREEDEAARAGRRSWRTPGEVLAERPYLMVDTITGPRRSAP